MREKIGVTDDQFKKYLQVLLGDKDEEKVLESMTKVDKAMRTSSPRPTRMFSRGRGRANSVSVECYYCHQYGHYQSYCPTRLARGSGSAPSAKGALLQDSQISPQIIRICLIECLS